MLSMLVSLLVTIPLCYAPAAFVAFLVRERACKSKRVRSCGTYVDPHWPITSKCHSSLIWYHFPSHGIISRGYHFLIQ